MLRPFTGWMIGLFAAGLVAAIGSPARADLTIDKTTQESGSTLPYAETEITFKYPGIIKDVFVKEGDRVEKDQRLMAQEDSEDQVEYQADQSLAKSPAAVNSANAALASRRADVTAKEADLAAKTKEFERVKKANYNGGSDTMELDKAQDDMESAAAAVDSAKAMVNSATADVDKAQLDRDQAQYKADHQKAHLDQMIRKAPTAAVVQSVTVEPGDSIDPNKNVGITLVQIDKLKVEFLLPAMEAQKLSLGQKLKVSYDGTNWNEASVSFLAPVALAGANGLQKVHMLLDNPELKTAGQSVVIQLPPEIVAMRKAAMGTAAAVDSR